MDCPGNVAELRHVLPSLAAKRTEILAALRRSNRNRSRAASLLGIGRTTLYRKLNALGIDDEALLS